MAGMKSISASIVALSGAVLLSAGAVNNYNDASGLVAIFGFLVSVAGLAGWIGAMIGKFN
jgi:hypothetical protein